MPDFIRLPVISPKEERYMLFVNAESIHSVAPILDDRCLVCFGPQAKSVEVEMTADTLLDEIGRL